MAHPFAYNPTVEQYLQAAQQKGCKLTVTTITDRHGRPRPQYILTQGTQEPGKPLPHVLITNYELNDRITPAIIGNYDARLGIKSGFSDAQS